MSTLAAIDDNMIPGQTYTFQLSLQNLITQPSVSKIQSDLNGYAPTFVSNDLQVTKPDTSNPLDSSFWKATYNIQFTYNGDGSDVISDVAASLIASIKTGSNDDFNFIGAVADSASTTTGSGSITDSVTDAVNNTLDKLTKGISEGAKNLGQGAGSTVQSVLTPVEIAVGVVVLLVVVLIFTAGKSGGVSGGPSGFKVGG